MSFGDTHGMRPPQKDASALDGVPPPENDTAYLSFRTSQCSGTSPSHGTPESFIAG